MSSLFRLAARRAVEKARHSLGMGHASREEQRRARVVLGAAVSFGVAGAAASGPLHAEELGDSDVPRHFDEMGYRHIKVKGRVSNFIITSTCLQELQQEFKLRSSDIVIATYPKCGTSWMQQILLTLLHGGDASKVQAPMAQAAWIEPTVCRARLGIQPLGRGENRTVQELMAWDGEIGSLPAPPRRAFKTHAPVDLVPWRGGLAGCGGAKVVVVTRNPKDAGISMFHHIRGYKPFQYTGGFHHFMTALFLKGNVASGCFWDWHAGWERAAEQHPGTVIWVSFEELKRDFDGTVRRLGKFLDIPVTEELIAGIRDASSFQAMKSQAVKADADGQARGVGTKNNQRKGEMGSWRGDMQGELLAEFDAVHSAKMAASGLKYKFDFGDL